MRIALLIVFTLAATLSAAAEEPSYSYPLIKGYGGIASQPDAVEQPRAGAKIVFDITVESKPDDVNRGLESVARYLNLNARAGHSPGDVKLALVLHGGATRCALSDDAYSRATGASTNPNTPLFRELRKHGVELFVCGQSLARNKFSSADVSKDLSIAASAMTVNVNKQMDGYAYLSLH